MITIINKFKAAKSNFNFGKVLLALVLTVTMLTQMFVVPVSASPVTKTMTIEFEESTSRNRNKVINIPNLKEIIKVTVNTGNVQYDVNDENINISVANGTVSRYADQTDSKYISSHTSPNYNSGGYSGSLDWYKSDTIESGREPTETIRRKTGKRTGVYGKVYIVLGVPGEEILYDPPLQDYETLEDWAPTDDQAWAFMNIYDDLVDNGRIGTATAYATLTYSYDEYEVKTYYSNSLRGSKTVKVPYDSWEWIPEENRYGYVTRYRDEIQYLTKSFEDTRSTFTKGYAKNSNPSSISYATTYDGYSFSGTLYAEPISYTIDYYRGYVYRTTKIPYYSYTVTIEYIDNQEPELSVTLPSENAYFGKEGGHNSIFIEGNVKDNDENDTIDLKYTLHHNETATDLVGHTNVIVKSNLESASGKIHDFSYTINVNENIPDGEYTLKVIAEDDKQGITEKSVTINIDNTGPISELKEENVKAIDTKSIRIKAIAEDNMVGLKDDNTYLYNRDGEDLNTWTKNDEIVDSNLKANKKYSYKFKAVDKLDNIGEYSNIIDRYTLALNPVKVKLTNSKADSLTFEITNNVDNDEVPETKLIAKKKLTTETVSISDWSKETIKTISGLTDGQEYEIYLNARNGDKIPNYSDGSEIKLTSSSNPPLVNDKGEPINDVITIPKKPIIKEVIPTTSEIEAKELKVTWDAVTGATKYALYVIPEGEERKLVNDNITDLTFTHTGLTPNRKYTYYLQAGNAGGFSEDSEPVERYTQALSVKGANGLKVVKSNADSVILNVINDAKNHNAPETQIEIKDKSGNIISTSPFTTDIENRTLINLSQNVEYEVWVTTRNKDKDGLKITNAPELVFNSFFANRKPELQSITLSEGSHHKGKPLKVNVQSKEFDIGDKINAFYSITGILTAQNKQISRPLDADPFNYQHNSTIAEYVGYIDFTGDEANGTYEITFWLEDNSGLKSDTIVKTFKIVKEDYYLENLKDIAEKGTNEELKEALKEILGDEFDELYFPNPLPEHMTENEYLDIIREQIKDMKEPITKEAVRKMIALVNINCRLSFGRQNTIPKKEIVIVLDAEAHRYKDSYLSDYQKELKRAYGKDGKPIMRLDEIDVLNAIKLVNFNKMPIESITIEIIKDLIGDNPLLNNNLIDDYKEAIKDLRDEIENPTLEDIKNTIEIVNINDKIDKGTLTIEDLKKLLPDLVIYPEYWNEYLRYLRMYKIDLGRNLNKDDIRKVIESVNGVIDYEKSATDDNHNKAKEKISLLVDGMVKTELTERISPLEKPIIDTSIYDNQSKNTLNRLSSVLDCYTASEPVLIELMGNKTIVSSTPIIDLRVINIKGASHIRYMSQENTKDSYNEWKPINSNEDIRKLVYKDQGIYLSGVQAKNSYKQSEIEDINVVVDWTAPTGKIVKKNPSQTVTKNSSITIKVVAEDNLKMPMYIKVNGYWQELKDEFFEYELDAEEGEKLIEVILSDVAGNKTYLHERVWRVN